MLTMKRLNMGLFEGIQTVSDAPLPPSVFCFFPKRARN